MSSGLIADVIAGLEELDSDPGVNVIIIMSNIPRVFCAGRDLEEGSSAKTDDIFYQLQFAQATAGLWLKMQSVKKVIIGAVHGFALAAGTGIAACCDIVVAADNAVFGLPEINVGLWPGTVGPIMARIATHVKRYFELCVTGDRFSAAEARELGLVNRVVAPDKLEEEAVALAQKIASKSPTTLQIGKRAFYDFMDIEYTKGVDYSANLTAIIANTHDGKEGQKAFKEKRQPQWQKPE